MPVRPLGMAAISSLPPARSSTAEAMSISESLAPEQKLSCRRTRTSRRSA
jgi:hypothetical protein